MGRLTLKCSNSRLVSLWCSLVNRWCSLVNRWCISQGSQWCSSPASQWCSILASLWCNRKTNSRSFTVCPVSSRWEPFPWSFGWRTLRWPLVDSANTRVLPYAQELWQELVFAWLFCSVFFSGPLCACHAAVTLWTSTFTSVRNARPSLASEIKECQPVCDQYISDYI